jgi:RNA-directed DNA polymerase
VLCQTPGEAAQARGQAERLLGSLRLELNPEKTRVIDLSEGRQGFDFLGCHFRARVSGRLLERGVRRCYLHRWPSARSMKRVRAKIRERTGRNRVAVRDIGVVIDDLDPVLRGWGNDVRTGNASRKFVQIDDSTQQRLRRLPVARPGRNLRPGQPDQWTSDRFRAQGLHR